ncbi:TonB-dependent receptor [Sphingomonas sp. DT-204]|uniref:TonB-dependent receptor n=1 Tax=Sphingomonas sp. DT-204 TaxID=3396166 RepID=UPI003F1BEE57
MIDFLPRPRLAAALLSSCVLIAVPAAAQDRSFDIPAQPLPSALTTWSRQAKVQIFFPSEPIRERRSPLVEGRMPSREALRRLIAGSSLRIVTDNGDTVTLGRANAVSHADPVSQDSSHASTGEQVDDIVVTGIRQSIETAIAAKRDADAIVDAVGSEDVGKFPDENVAESLQRVTGVQVERVRGEAQEVNIRGLGAGQVQVQFNGRVLPSAINDSAQVDRSFNFSILPAEFVRRAEVYKTPTASMAEGGMAGTVIVRTPRALDIGKSILSLSAQGAWEDNTASVAPRISGLYAGIFADGKIGVTLGAAYTRRVRETDLARFYAFTSATERSAKLDLNGDGRITNDTVEYAAIANRQIQKEETDRLSGLASIQFRPTETLTLTAEGMYSRLHDVNDQSVMAYRWSSATGPTDPSSITLAPGRDAVRAVRLLADNVDVRPSNVYMEGKGDLVTASLGGRYRTDGWTVDAEAAFSRSTQTLNQFNLSAQGRFAVGYDTTADGEMASIFFGGDDAQAIMDPNNYRVLNMSGIVDQKAVVQSIEARLDVGHDFSGSVLRRLQFGGRYSETKFEQNNPALTITAAALDDLYGGALGPSPAFGSTSVSAASFLGVATASRGDFLGAYDGPATFPRSFLASNTKAVLDRYSVAQLVAAGTSTDDPTGWYDITERAYAGYVQLDFGRREAGLSGNIGIRAVWTEQSSVGISPDFTAITYDPETGKTTVPAAGTMEINRGYWDFLPSANLRWSLGDGLVARASASRTITRPPLNVISPTSSANGDMQTITRSNPYINPWTSNNVDVGLEWYFGKRSLLSVNAFYKYVDSLIYNQTKIQSVTVNQINADGSTTPTQMDFSVTMPINGESATIKGVEVGYQQPFTFLPTPFDRFGFIGNYTFVLNNNRARLPYSSKHSFNLSGYYEDRRLSVRLAYTFRDAFARSDTGQYGDGSQSLAYGALNGNITFRLTKNVSAVIEGSNLLNQARILTSLYGTYAPNIYEDSGRRFLFGVRGRF